jgi:hypothetical protein
MRGTNVGSSKSCPATVIPERGQISDNHVCASASDGSDVFQEDEPRSKLADKADDFAVKAASLSLQASTGPGEAEILAWESGGDDVELSLSEVASGLFGGKSGNVVPNRCDWQSTVGHP